MEERQSGVGVHMFSENSSSRFTSAWECSSGYPTTECNPPGVMTHTPPTDSNARIMNGDPHNIQVQNAFSDSAIAGVDGGSDKDKREEDDNLNVFDEETVKDNIVLDLIAESNDNNCEDVNTENHSNHTVQGSCDSEVEEAEDVVDRVQNPGAADIKNAVHEDEAEDIAMYDKPVGSSATAPSLPSTVSVIGQGCGSVSIFDSNSVKPAVPAFLFMPTTCMTFNPLLKWEYENGFPIDGVTDTTRWAAEVGLEVGSQDPEVQRKRRKLLSATDPPKYVCTYTHDDFSPDDEDGNSTPTEATSDADEEGPPVSRKGKKKATEGTSDADEEGAPVSQKGKEKVE